MTTQVETSKDLTLSYIIYVSCIFC